MENNDITKALDKLNFKLPLNVRDIMFVLHDIPYKLGYGEDEEFIKKYINCYNAFFSFLDKESNGKVSSIINQELMSITKDYVKKRQS